MLFRRLQPTTWHYPNLARYRHPPRLAVTLLSTASTFPYHDMDTSTRTAAIPTPSKAGNVSASDTRRMGWQTSSTNSKPDSCQ